MIYSICDHKFQILIDIYQRLEVIKLYKLRKNDYKYCEQKKIKQTIRLKCNYIVVFLQPFINIKI